MRDLHYTASIAFLRKVFSLAADRLELRVIPNNGGGAIRRAFFSDDDGDKIVGFLQENDVDGFAVYFGCATRKPGVLRGTKLDLSEFVSLWVDIDCYKLGLSVEQVFRRLRFCAIPPSLIVSSGGGVHAYWLLRERLDVSFPPTAAADIEAFEVVLKRLALAFCGDPMVAQGAAVMRLVGTGNSKTGIRRECTVLHDSELLYELDELAAELEAMPQWISAVSPEGAEAHPLAVGAAPGAGGDDPFAGYGSGATVDVEGDLARMSYQHPEYGIHRVRVRVAASLVGRGVSEETIFERLLEATVRAAGLAGEKWNWKAEKAAIRGEIRSAVAKGWAPKPPGVVVQMRPGQQPAPGPEPEPAATGYIRNDIGNAMQLLALHRAQLCYVIEAGWHIWDGKRFRCDNEMLTSHRLAHDVSTQQLAAALRVADKDARKAAIKWAISSGSQSRISAMLHEARSYVAHEADDMDANIWLLNCQNGVLDLRDGTLRPHAPADLITKICGTVYEKDASCPRWETFLAEIFDGDQQMIRFVQCALGYSLTGSVRDNFFFILHGTGKNGKSKLLETAAHVLGDYMITTPADTWAEKPPGAASNDIAALPGARFVTTNETEKNHSLRAGLVKQITGGDKVSARKMFREFFEFTPQCKLWIATNNKPKVSGSDGAIWDRIRLLPFNVKFVPQEELIEGQRVRDNELMDKLLAELPGILAWMVRGCAEWQRSGLPPAVAITEAAEVYRASQDSVQGFIDECCDVSHGMTCAVKDLFAAYEIWCGAHDEEVLSKKAFGTNLDERGYPAGKSGSVRYRKRLDLKGKWRIAAETGAPPTETEEGKTAGT
jgi:P4 family phage/plasmid primase-like protien